jgi:gamma-carbonic anhydrase
MRKAVHLFGTALRETGQAMDRLGLTFSGNEIYKETFSRHRPVMNLFDKV